MEADVDYHYQGLRLREAFLDPTTIKRVRRAELPVRESERVTEMLGKVAAIAKALQETRQECSKMHVALEQAREETRIAEFAKEKANALATARGNALMKCQDALANAEEQQIQMGGMLRSALEQLGVHSPDKRMNIEQQLCKTPGYAPQQHLVISEDINSSGQRRMMTPQQTPALMRSSLAVSPHHLTPPTGFTVYSNALSEDISPHLYDENNIMEGATEYGEGPNTASPGSKTCEIGPNTAERLARMVLPHLDSEQIQCLVEYNGRNTHSPIASHGNSPVVQQATPNMNHQEYIQPTFKRSTFSAMQTLEKDDGMIKAHGSFVEEYSVDDDQRKRQAAMRIMEKLNRKLPPELRRGDYDDWLHAQ